MRLTKKHLERLAMALIMAFPVGYLFFTQIFALGGAHGEEILADNATTSEYVEVNEMDSDLGSYYKFVVNDENVKTLFLSSQPNRQIYGNYYLNGTLRTNGTGYTFLLQGYTGDSYKRIYTYPANTLPFPIFDGYGNFSLPLPWTFESNSVFMRYLYPWLHNYGTLYKLVEVPTPVQEGYRNTLFDNIFGQSNFLTEWGTDVLSETPHGFAPFASMIKYLDENMLHLGERNYGLMAYGQLYYMLNVSVFFLIFKTMVFIPNMITKLFNWFGKENNEND